MTITLDGSSGITTPGLTNTGNETVVNLTTTGNTILGDASTDTLNVGNGGLIKDASGNLGLGVTPSAWRTANKAVQIGLAGSVSSLTSAGRSIIVGSNFYTNSGGTDTYITTGYASNYIQYEGAHLWNTAGSGTAGNPITFTQAMTLDASGNLLLNRTSGYNAGTYQSQKFKVTGGIGINSDPADLTSRLTLLGDSSTGNGTIDWSSGFSLIFSGNGTERARIDSSGRLLVNVTSSLSGMVSIHNNASDYGLTVGDYYNTTKLVRFLNSSDAQIGSITQTGSSTAYNTSSDYRLKNISGKLTGYKERIMALQPKQGYWKADGSEFRGFLAHEFANQYPSLVNGEKDAVDEEGNPQYQGMQAGGSETIADLVAYIQELETRLAALENK